jgi:hypothetical protein
MSIGELYDEIEKRLPATVSELTRDLASSTDATLYDVTSAVNALYRASRIKPTEDTEGKHPALTRWELDPRGHA